MTIGIIGLGKMGMQIARRLHRKGHKVIAWNRSVAPRKKYQRFGGKTAESVPALVARLPQSRIVWTMLPAGAATESVMFGEAGLYSLLRRGDIIIDGANENYKTTIRRAKRFSRKGIVMFDAGTSGGIHGEKNGFSIMVGGPRRVWPKIKPVIRDLAADDSYGLVGEVGSGNFVKMVHNGIEYGMMEAIAEGFALIHKWNPKINLAQVAKIWRKGSVVSSWLIDLTRDIFEREDLAKVVGLVKHTGEGAWTVETAKKLGVDVRVIEAALRVRKESEKKKNQKLLRNKILALLRNRFGGHEVIRKG